MVQMKKKKLEQLFLSKRKIWHVNLKKKNLFKLRFICG